MRLRAAAVPGVAVQIRKFSLLPKLLILLASCALSIGLIECVFRVLQGSDPSLSVDVIAADQQVQRDLHRKQVYPALRHMLDNAFLNLLANPAQFEKGHLRVLFLGDSFTQGAGIKDLEDRFSNILQRRANDEAIRDQSSQRLTIFNAGVAKRLDRLLQDFEFGPLREMIHV